MDTNKQNNKKIWHTQQEKILKVWGEQSACYRYMHFKSYQKYKKSSMRFTLPIIIISTITGTANFAQDTFPVTWRPLVPAGIGAFNLIAAIMTTILQFLKINELMESHRVSSIQYGKLSRSVRLQLTLPRDERYQNGAEFIEYCFQEYDRLIEQSPTISKSIIKLFEKEFPLRKQKNNKGNGEQRTCCLDIRRYCCSSFKDDVDEKELNLERPEIIKLNPIKPFGFHDGTTRSDASQTASTETEPMGGPIRPRFKSHPPLPPTPILTPPEGDTPNTSSEPAHIMELTKIFGERAKIKAKTIEMAPLIPEPDSSPPFAESEPEPEPEPLNSSVKITVDDEEIVESKEVILKVEELRQRFNQPSDS